MNPIVVSKFGGTSMGDAACMLRSAQVTLTQKSQLVVVSATSGTTNQLITLGQIAEKSLLKESLVIVESLKKKHLLIAAELKLNADKMTALETLLHEIEAISQGINLLKDCSLKAMDQLMSLGERMSSVLFSQALENVIHTQGLSLQVRRLDARDVLKTDNQFSKAKPLIAEMATFAQAKIPHDPQLIYVTQGFIGQTLEGHTTTLGRGGSDYSAALFAEAIGADILEIWTDVAGIATTDPRICSEAKPISEITFQEASELATFGAKILHPATLLPAIRKGIPVFVGSSFEPEKGGTWVRQESSDRPLVRALAQRKRQVLVTLSTPEMLNTHGFLFRIFKIFNDHKVSIDAITTSEISVSVTLDDSTLLNKNLLSDLSQIADVTVEENLCLISLIGNKINHTPGLAKRIFESISDINVRMICLGASKHNFCFIVEETQGNQVIQRLHSQFIQ